MSFEWTVNSILNEHFNPIQTFQLPLQYELKHSTDKLTEICVFTEAPAGKRLGRAAGATLESVFLQHNHPNDAIIEGIVTLHKMSRKQVLEWFIERRRIASDGDSLKERSSQRHQRPSTGRKGRYWSSGVLYKKLNWMSRCLRTYCLCILMLVDLMPIIAELICPSQWL